jgi:Flp pilus assembly protein TadG
MLRLFSSLRRDQKGASLVEFTILSPLVLTLGFGILEFGNALYGHHVITTGVHDAARYLARFTTPSAHYADAKNLAVTGAVAGTTQRLSWWNASAVTIAMTTVANPIDPSTGERTYRGPDPLSVVRVSTTATYPGFGLLSYLGLGSSLTMTVYHEERVIHE